MSKIYQVELLLHGPKGQEVRLLIPIVALSISDCIIVVSRLYEEYNPVIIQIEEV